MAKRKKLNPIHPGEILLEEFLEPMSISQYRLAKDIHVPPRRIMMIVSGMVMGHGFYSIVSLDAGTVIVAGLTVLYGVALGVVVKALRKLKG